MVELTGALAKLARVKILVVGDLMLDAYTLGKTKRISPEAPVPVLNVIDEQELPGGAGNVMLNLRALGADVVAVGRIGSDQAGISIKQHLQANGVDVTGVYEQPNYPTPVKNRIIANNQQLVRVDREVIADISECLEERIIADLPSILQGVQAVAISDYGKGLLTQRLLKALIDESRKRDIPTIVDPKGVDYSRYAHATIIKPNLSEAYAAAAMDESESIQSVADKLLRQIQAELLMVTRSEDGISLFYPDGKQENYPVKVRAVKDVTGAGDTVLAMLSFAVANQLSHDEATRLANIAAGIAIEMLGCATITMEQLSRRLLHFNTHNKVFDEMHLFTLKLALTNRKLKVLGLSSEKDLSSSLLRTIFDLSQSEEYDLLIYIQDDSPDEDFVHALSSLREVDFIILKGESLRHLCEEVEPEEVYFHNGETLVEQDSFASIL